MREESVSIAVNAPTEAVAELLREAAGPTKVDEVCREIGWHAPKPPKVVASEWPNRIAYEYPDARIEVGLLQRGDRATNVTIKITWRGFGNRSRAIYSLLGFVGIAEWFERGYAAGKKRTHDTPEKEAEKGV